MNRFTNAFLTNSLNLNKEETKLVMDAQRKFPSILIEECEGICLDARELHKELGVSKAFTTWIKTNLESIDAQEVKDYSISFKGKLDTSMPTADILKNMLPQQRGGYGISTEYKLTLDIAKEICMVTGLNPNANDKLKQNSKLCRKYFILMEKAIKKGIDWGKIREPQKESYKIMCSALEKQYIKAHNGKNPNKFLYTNNADMLNIALFGYKSKKMKEVLEVEYEYSLRDNLKLESNKALDEMQTLNTNLVILDEDYATRKNKIEIICKAKFEKLRINIAKEFVEELKVA